MAEYKMHIEEESGITFVEITGISRPEDHAAYMRSGDYEQRTSLLLADLRQASLSGMTRGTIAKMVRAVQPLGKDGIRAAFVFSRGEDFAKGKLMKAQLETLGYDGRFKIFTDYEKALEWVKK